MLKIRLARFGKKNRPSYRLVVSDSRKDTRADYLESVGFYDPVAQPKQVNIKEDRVRYWLSVGAQMSPTVHNLLVSQGIIQGPKVKATKNRHKDNMQKDVGQKTEISDEKPDANAKADEAGGAAEQENPSDVSEDKSE